MNYYIHNIDPTILKINIPESIFFLPNTLEIRWYGIAYLLGFIASYLLLRLWSRRGSLKISPEQVSNFIFLIAIFGVFLGGRLGYVLFYDFSHFWENKWSLFQIWKGGMSSHGGLIGVIAVMLWYAKKYNISFWNLSDHLAITASLGIAFGRIANFINGELWGRVTDVKWAVIFPQSGTILPRHPSQLYQSIFEGFLVFILILWIKKTYWGKKEAAVSCSYLILYAVMRILVEFLREPDSTVYFEWITKGQLYSLVMILASILIIWKKKLIKFNLR